MTIGEKIAQLRKREGLSQKELADLVGIASSTVSGYETASRGIKPNSEICKKLADIFDVTQEYLFDNNVGEISASNRIYEFNKIIGNLIKFYRKQEKTSQFKVSKELSVDNNIISRIETGVYGIEKCPNLIKRYPEIIPQLKKYSKEYKINIDKILDEINTKDIKKEDLIRETALDVNNTKKEEISIDEDTKEEKQINSLEYYSIPKKNIIQDVNNENIFKDFRSVESNMTILIFDSIHNKLMYTIHNPESDIDRNQLKNEILWYKKYIKTGAEVLEMKMKFL